jgi:hypothetical protein
MASLSRVGVIDAGLVDPRAIFEASQEYPGITGGGKANPEQ